MTREIDPLRARLDQLQSQDRRVPTGPAEAQADYEAAGQLPLSQEETISIVRYMMQQDQMKETSSEASGNDQDIVAYATRLATVRRQKRLWQAVAGLQAAALVMLAGLWLAPDQPARKLDAKRNVPGIPEATNGRTNTSSDADALSSTSRVQVLTSYLTLRQQVLQRGADALPTPIERTEPVPPVTMEELLRAAS